MLPCCRRLGSRGLLTASSARCSSVSWQWLHSDQCNCRGMTASFRPSKPSSLSPTLPRQFYYSANTPISVSRELLVLADGYLLSALFVIPHILSFPGAFAPAGSDRFRSADGALDLYILAFRLFRVRSCVCLREKTNRWDTGIELVSFRPIYWNAAAIIGLVCALSWFVTTGQKLLPRLVADEVHFAPAASYATAVTVITSLLALIVLWRRRRSMLDLWVLVAIVATVAEQAVTAFLISGRFSLGFYVSRGFAVAVSTIVLTVLLSETVAVYCETCPSDAEAAARTRE